MKHAGENLVSRGTWLKGLSGGCRDLCFRFAILMALSFQKSRTCILSGLTSVSMLRLTIQTRSWRVVATPRGMLRVSLRAAFVVALALSIVSYCTRNPALRSGGYMCLPFGSRSFWMLSLHRVGRLPPVPGICASWGFWLLSFCLFVVLIDIW